MDTRHESLWVATTTASPHPTLQHDLTVDVAIIGAGIAGLTAATLLKGAGKTVAVLESGKVARGESGFTTAHLTEAIDVRYPALTRDFGKEGARLAAKGSRDAIEQIKAFIGLFSIECAFSEVPAYLYAEEEKDLDLLKEEVEQSRQAGLDSHFTTEVPLPFSTKGAVRYENQAQFHPRAYLLALLPVIEGDGSFVFEECHVTEVRSGEPCTVHTSKGTITATDVIVAANVPINDRFLLHTKLAAYRTYAMAAAVPAGFLPPALYWDTEDPYHYTRLQLVNDQLYLIVGGYDHKTGTKEDTEESYASLREYVNSRFGISRADFSWSGQIIEPVDGLPYIGKNPDSEHVYVATGFGGQGMTFGTLSGMINADLILGRENDYASLFVPSRVKPVAGLKDFVTENIDYPKHMLQDLANLDVQAKELSAVAPGEGKIIRHEGKKVAAYRSEEGVVHLLSPVCPHMRCDVAWNTAEKSWDCPCHGSRFSCTGEKVLNGPAVSGLEKVEG